MVSDNAKTFKSASKELEKITYDPSVVKYFAQEKIKWSYNLEKPHGGKVFTNDLSSHWRDILRRQSAEPNFPMMNW